MSVIEEAKNDLISENRAVKVKEVKKLLGEKVTLLGRIGEIDTEVKELDKKHYEGTKVNHYENSAIKILREDVIEKL